MSVAMSTMPVPMSGPMPMSGLAVDKLRPPIKNKPRGGSKPKSLVLDPEDLARRLEVVLVEREAYVERKRRSRANIDRASRHYPVLDQSRSRRGREAPPDNAPYPVQDPNPIRASAARRSAHASHYLSMVNMDPPEPPGQEYKPGFQNVPRMAASQHSLTTNDHADSHQASHKLSREAMKFHMGGSAIQRKPVAGEATRDSMQDVARRRSQREGVYHRNQFQHPAAMDNIDIGLTECQNQPGNRHTFNAFARDSTGEDDTAPKRISMSSMKGQYRGEADFGESMGGIPPLPEHDENFAPPARRTEGRADWTQSDNHLDRSTTSGLRKPRSRWTLRERLSLHRSSKGDKDMMKDESGLSHQRSKNGFFSLFRRNS